MVVLGPGVMVTEGAGFTFTVVVAAEEHPLVPETVTVYCVVRVGLATGY
jgi:hypothetical protein